MMVSSAESVPFAAMRQAMVASQLRTSAVNDARVVEVMARVPREAFLPEAVRDLAYRDTLLPLGDGRMQNLPLATGRLLTEAQVSAGDHVLLIGAAGGYTAAVLAELARSVVAVESDATLAEFARSALSSDKVTLIEGPLAEGSAANGPYDLIVIDGAIEHVPDSLVDQLKPGGRAVAGLVDRGVTRLAAGVRTDGGFGLVDFADIECARLPGFARPRTFQF